MHTRLIAQHETLCADYSSKGELQHKYQQLVLEHASVGSLLQYPLRNGPVRLNKSEGKFSVKQHSVCIHSQEGPSSEQKADAFPQSVQCKCTDMENFHLGARSSICLQTRVAVKLTHYSKKTMYGLCLSHE